MNVDIWNYTLEDNKVDREYFNVNRQLSLKTMNCCAQIYSKLTKLEKDGQNLVLYLETKSGQRGG